MGLSDLSVPHVIDFSVEDVLFAADFEACSLLLFLPGLLLSACSLVLDGHVVDDLGSLADGCGGCLAISCEYGSWGSDGHSGEHVVRGDSS